MVDDDLERFARSAEALGKSLEAARGQQTTATGAGGDINVVARAGRLVSVELGDGRSGGPGAAAAHNDFVAALRDTAAQALRESNELTQEVSQRAIGDLFSRGLGTDRA